MVSHIGCLETGLQITSSCHPWQARMLETTRWEQWCDKRNLLTNSSKKYFNLIRAEYFLEFHFMSAQSISQFFTKIFFSSISLHYFLKSPNLNFLQNFNCIYLKTLFILNLRYFYGNYLRAFLLASLGIKINQKTSCEVSRAISYVTNKTTLTDLFLPETLDE